jgi:hypothetical protein
MRPEVEALGYLEARAEADSRGSDRKKCKGFDAKGAKVATFAT